MNILLTNDDGIDAPGLAALAAACHDAWPAAGRVIVVAPKEPHSGCGHRVTTDRPLVLEQVGSDRFHVDGTPADCVRLALATLFSESAPPLDWVLSGINAGGNLGVDIHHSGTVAAAREAALHGVKSLAVSHYHRREEPIDWQRAARWMTAILTSVVGRGGPGGEPLAAGEFWNVNFPHPLAAEAELPSILHRCRWATRASPRAGGIARGIRSDAGCLAATSRPALAGGSPCRVGKSCRAGDGSRRLRSRWDPPLEPRGLPCEVDVEDPHLRPVGRLLGDELVVSLGGLVGVVCRVRLEDDLEGHVEVAVVHLPVV